MSDQPPPVSIAGAAEAEHRFDLREFLSFLWRQWKFIAIVTAAVLTVGSTFLLRQTPLYTATSQILLDRQREKAPGAEAILTDVNFDIAMIESQMAIIRSSVFLRRVVEKERLSADEPGAGAAQEPAPEGWSIWRSLRWIVGAPPGEARPTAVTVGSDTIPANELRAIEVLKGAVSVSRVAQHGYVLAISVTASDPARAARLANAVADAYLVDKLDTRFEAAKRASAWLSDRLVELRNQLRESEEAVSQFRSEHGLIQNGNLTLNQQQLADLNAKLIDAKADLAQKKARVDLLSSIQAKGGSLQSMPDITNGGALPTLRHQASTISQQEADLLARYGASHPLVVNIRAQERDVERSIAAEVQRLASSIRNEHELAQTRVASLEKSLREATGQSSIDDATAIRLRELERTAAVNKSLFEDFLQRAKITQEQSTFETREARVISPALPPGAPSYPRKLQFLALNLLIGLLFGVGGAVAKERLNAGFTTRKQIEDMLGLPLLTSVKYMTAGDLTVDERSVAIHDYPMMKPLSRYGEAIRALRSGIQMTNVDDPPKIIQFTSAVPDEGKTTIALSVAASAATSKLKVLFVDADLRHPSASRMFELHKEAGLVDLLLGHVDAQEVIRFHERSGYWVLPAGDKTQNPTDLLGSERMKTLIAHFRETFDLVVIDTPPAGPVIDPVVVSQMTDKIVLVVRWATTARELVKQCVQQLSGHKKIAGVTFNHVNDRQAEKYGRDGYSYYYSSRYYKSYYAE
jgi:succinoglycan biosynthesis transport protein ExoP